MKFSVLSSSSSGNCIYLEIENHCFLLDCGLSLRQIKSKLSILGISLSSLDGIFITHEHHDHISGLASVNSAYKTRIYMSKDTYRNLPEELKMKVSPLQFSFVKANEEFDISGISVLPFRLSHDAIDPLGYRIKDENGKELVYITDTGCFIVPNSLKNADAYVLESNHEPDVLLMSARPWQLKNRIMSEYGHLSNNDSAKIFDELKGEKTKLLVLYHLSDECNSKDLALLAYDNYFSNKGESLNNINIVVSDKTVPTKILEV